MKQDSSKGRGAWEIYSESLHVFPNAKETSPFAYMRLTALFRAGLAGEAECVIRRNQNTYNICAKS